MPFRLSFTVEQPSMGNKWKNVQAECGDLMRYVWALETVRMVAPALLQP